MPTLKIIWDILENFQTLCHCNQWFCTQVNTLHREQDWKCFFRSKTAICKTLNLWFRTDRFRIQKFVESLVGPQYEVESRWKHILKIILLRTRRVVGSGGKGPLREPLGRVFSLPLALLIFTLLSRKGLSRREDLRSF